MNAPRLGVGVIVKNYFGDVLLGTRGKEPGMGKLVIPGGGVKFGERIEACAKREVLEETGLELDRVNGPHKYSEIIEDGFHKFVVIMSSNYLGERTFTGCDEFQNPHFYNLQRIDVEKLWMPTYMALNDLGYMS